METWRLKTLRIMTRNIDENVRSWIRLLHTSRKRPLKDNNCRIVLQQVTFEKPRFFTCLLRLYFLSFFFFSWGENSQDYAQKPQRNKFGFSTPQENVLQGPPNRQQLPHNPSPRFSRFSSCHLWVIFSFFFFSWGRGDIVRTFISSPVPCMGIPQLVQYVPHKGIYQRKFEPGDRSNK